jgi:CSLREA domain-containing protein
MRGGRLIAMAAGAAVVGATVVAVAGVLPRWTPAANAAAPFTVNSTADAVDTSPGNGACATTGGSCTLRAAIQETNALAGADTINLPAGIYELTIAGSGEDAAASGDLDITDSLKILGAGDDVTTIDAAGFDRVIHVLGETTTVDLYGVEITGGKDPGFVHLNAGGILNEGVLTVEWSTVANNDGGDTGAGGIYNRTGSLTVIDSIITENDVGMGGAGILNDRGPMTVERTIVTHNGRCAPTGGIRSWDSEVLIVDSYVAFNNGRPCGDAGGITNGGSGDMTILGTTIEGNQGQDGGGVENAGDEMWIINSTISGNTATRSGGGLHTRDGSVFVVNATITDNRAPTGGGISKEIGDYIEMTHSILWNNTAADGPDCFGTIRSNDYNLVGTLADCTLTGATDHNLVGVNPRLGPLADNGGQTDTRALLSGSPAIDAGNPTPPDSGPNTCAHDDQREVARPQGSACDIGAFEVVNTFLDDDDSVFAKDIEWIAARGITRGCNPPANNRYCPDSYVTRGQMAAFLVRAMGYTNNGGGNRFIDDNNSIFEGDIDRLAVAGVTRGCNPPTNTRFCPNAKVTRGQIAAFLVRALHLKDDGGGNLFVDDNGSIFEGDIDRLGTAGVTRGCNPPVNNRYCPNNYVTRGQMAAFLHRALD